MPCRMSEEREYEAIVCRAYMCAAVGTVNYV